MSKRRNECVATRRDVRPGVRCCDQALSTIRRFDISTFIAFLLLISTAAHASDVVERRGAEGAVRGSIIQIDDAGVWIRSETGASQRISWDRVRRVETDNSLHVQDLAKYEEMAEELWRARTRVERRDIALGEPIFAKHFGTFLGQTNETALVVAEGLLRCRLDRESSTSGARVTALVPALEVARLRAAGVETVSYSTLPAVLDAETRLCPAIPPVWIGAAGLPGLERALAAYEDGGDEVIGAIAALYLRSVQQELGWTEALNEPLPRVQGRHAGVELLRDFVASGETDREAHRAARARLERQLGEQPEWAEAWSRFAIGRSMLRESGRGMQQRGALNMAHLPAQFSTSQPHLTAIALAHLAEFHEASGQVEGAQSLREELARRFPDYEGRDIGLTPGAQEDETAAEDQ